MKRTPTRPAVDFGPSADDYARHRPGFPGELYDRLRALGAGRPGQRVLDLGTGTGTLARGFAARGARVVGLDPSPEMLAGAAALAREEGLAVDWVRGWAEDCPLAARSCDVVCAGQCWHWFDRPRAAAEVARLLAPAGRAVIATLNYLVDPGSLGEATEALILARFPAWNLAGKSGRDRSPATDLERAGLAPAAFLDFDVELPFTHASWRGRMRACNGVFRMPPADIPLFDAALAALLAERFPEPLAVPHRVFAVVAGRPAGGPHAGGA